MNANPIHHEPQPKSDPDAKKHDNPRNVRGARDFIKSPADAQTDAAEAELRKTALGRALTELPTKGDSR